MNIASKLMGVGVANALAYEFQKQITNLSFDRYNLMALGFPHGASAYFEEASKVANVQAKELICRGVNPVTAKYLEDLSSKVPAVVNAPVISGNATVGATLTSDGGSAAGTGTITTTAAWYADDVVISGETGATYTVVAGDVGKLIKQGVKYCNSHGCSAEAFSNALGPVEA